MSARRILGLEQTFNCSPCGKPRGNNRAQNGEGHVHKRRGSPRGKDDSRSPEWADALSLLNVRSRGRRQNTAAMIQGFVSRND